MNEELEISQKYRERTAFDVLRLALEKQAKGRK